MSISHLAVKRPVFTLMIAVTMIVMGLVSLARLPVALLPDLTFPFAVVVAEYPNVGPFEVESQVTRPIEEAVATVANVKNVSSITLTGQATVIAEFNWGTDMDFAVLGMRERVDLIRSLLPDGITAIRIFRYDPTQEPIMQINVGGRLTEDAVRAFADDVVKPRLERLEGVASVSVEGGREREIHVYVDPTRLEQHGVTYQQVKAALSMSNLNLPGGKIQENGTEWIVRTVGEFERVQDVAQAVVHASPAGVVRLGDVATVVDGYKDTQRLSRLNGTPSITVSVQRESTGNTAATSARVHQEVERIRQEYGRDVDLQIIVDEARFIRSSIRSLAENAVLGAFFASLVLFLFLRNWITTLIVLTTMPTSAVATFAMLYFSGTSLNMLSLGGFALGIGMLIDNGIVVLENIFRRRELGDPPAVAAAEGGQEVGRALLASTITTVAIFLPVVFIEGLASELFRDLSYAVAFSIAMSLITAITLVPMLSARWLSPAAAGGGGADAAVMDADPLAPGPGLFGRFLARYARMLDGILQRRWIVVLVVVGLVGGAVAGASRLGMEFMPAMDTGEFLVDVEMPPGTALAETDRIVRRLEEYLASEVPEVQNILSSVGGSRPDRASLRVVLVDQEERERRTDQVAEQLRRFGAGLPGAKVSASIADMHGGGAGGGGPVEVRFKGDDLDELALLAERVAEKMRAIPGLREVTTSLSQARPELQVRVDRNRAAAVGLNVFQVASALRTAVEGEVVTRFRVEGDEIDVRVRLDEAFRSRPADLERIMIDTPLGIQVPLVDVARVEQGESPVEITRDSQARVVRVNAHLFERDLGSAMAEVRRLVAGEVLPRGTSVDYGGEDEQMREAFSDLGVALILAVVLVYIILAAQYESLTQPFIIMFTMPLAFVGGIWGLVVTGRPLSVPAFIGLIMVVGIVLNNGIVLVDYINQLRERGMDRRTALLAGCRTRLRPVLMTTATTVLAMMPLALGLGEGSEIQSPIAIVTIAGLVLSTMLTLALVPTVYSVVDDMTAWFVRVVVRRGRAAEDGLGVGARS